ncbi:MAG: hypothetical protein ACREUN_00695 [Burkholderiales bacterium]
MDANRNLSADLADYAGLSSVGITRNEVARIKNGRGLRLSVETGAVWIAPTMGGRFRGFWAGLYAPESRPTTAAL